jgi:FixJ family two-component response regulator
MIRNCIGNIADTSKHYAHEPRSVSTLVRTPFSHVDRASMLGEHVVIIVDDDYRVREALQELFAASNLCAVAFGSAAEFLAHSQRDVPTCLILDAELPDGNGLDLQQQMGDENHPAVIFVTGHGDIRSCVRAIKGGALDFLTKPFIEQELLERVHAALAQDRERRANQAGLNRLRERYRLLTPREREVLPLVVSGLLNKQAAAHLGISEITYQIHRTNVMRKMQADSLADLVRMASCLEILEASLRVGHVQCDTCLSRFSLLSRGVYRNLPRVTVSCG